MKTVLVSGSRDFTNKEVLFAVLDKVTKELLGGWDTLPPPDSVRIIHGANRGVEMMSTDWARARLCDYDEFPANWTRFKKEANSISYTKMILEDPDVLIAFPGTDANLISKAKFAQIKVIEVKGEI